MPIAEEDIDNIGVYMSQFYPSTFKNFLRSLENSIGSLQASPYMGVVHRDYRKLVIGDYLIFYKVDEERKAIAIFRVLHGARDWAPQIES